MQKIFIYKNPLKYRNTTNSQKFVVILDSTVKVNDRNKVGIITLRRPCVSAKKPHKCELDIIPKIKMLLPLLNYIIAIDYIPANPIALKIPLP